MNEMKLRNPYQITPKRWRENDMRFAGGHYYRVIFGHMMTRRKFRRATEAEAYGARVHARWCRLYDAAIAAAVVTEQG
jgi:hypothetical protein